MAAENHSNCADMLRMVEEEVPGWTPFGQLLSLFQLAVSVGQTEGDILEVGAWCGRSTVALAKAAEITKCRVHSVDLFPEREEWIQLEDGSYCVECDRGGEKVGFGRETTVWEEPFLNSIVPVYDEFGSPYQKYLASLKQFGVETQVAVNRMSIEQFHKANKSSDLKFALVLIDGDHSYQALCRDIAIAEHYLQPGGWLCFDDAFTSYDGIDQAINERIVQNNRYESLHQPARKMFVARRKLND